MNNYPENNNNSNPYQPGSYFRNPDPQNDPYNGTAILTQPPSKSSPTMRWVLSGTRTRCSTRDSTTETRAIKTAIFTLTLESASSGRFTPSSHSSFS